MGSRIIIFVPYFGAFPDTFELWLRGCKRNKDFNWIIYTDNDRKYDFPLNVSVKKISFERFKEKIEKKLGFRTGLKKPYKLCDFRPLYGWIFSDEVCGYTHWGYSDIDLLYGNLSNFISDDILFKYDKVNALGHLCIYKNIREVNCCFMKCDYKEILEDSNSRIFDEVRFSPNINELLISNGFKIKDTIPYADISPFHFNFELYEFYGGRKTKRKKRVPLIFEYSDGLFGCSIHNNQVTRKEYVYVHFQKRKMQLESDELDRYIMIPNRILPHENVTTEFVLKNSKDNILYTFTNYYARIRDSVKRRTKGMIRVFTRGMH